MSRLIALAVLAGCAGGPPLEPISPGGPPVRISMPAEGPISLFWSSGAALEVEIHHLGTGRVVWTATAGSTRSGPEHAVLDAPLEVAAFGPPPSVHPPDGRGPSATAPLPITTGERYVVTVSPCQRIRDGPCRALDVLTDTFETRRDFYATD